MKSKLLGTLHLFFAIHQIGSVLVTAYLKLKTTQDFTEQFIHIALTKTSLLAFLTFNIGVLNFFFCIANYGFMFSGRKTQLFWLSVLYILMSLVFLNIATSYLNPTKQVAIML